MDPVHPPGIDQLADAVRDAEASRRASPALENVLGQVPGLRFIAKSVAPRGPAVPIRP